MSSQPTCCYSLVSLISRAELYVIEYLNRGLMMTTTTTTKTKKILFFSLFSLSLLVVVLLPFSSCYCFLAHPRKPSCQCACYVYGPLRSAYKTRMTQASRARKLVGPELSWPGACALKWPHLHPYRSVTCRVASVKRAKLSSKLKGRKGARRSSSWAILIHCRPVRSCPVRADDRLGALWRTKAKLKG